jgi:hypothetical protein
MTDLLTSGSVRCVHLETDLCDVKILELTNVMYTSWKYGLEIINCEEVCIAYHFSLEFLL